MIKKLFFLLIAVVLCLNADAQWTNKTMVSGSLTRSYRIYVSPNYNASDLASLVITLHGLGDNMTNFSTLGFNYIADTANIIVICPQAVSDAYAGTAWNSGAGYMGYYPNSTVNDIAFINALADTARANFSIDPKRMYICGFSMGGFMTERMALQSNLNYAAFASMSGTIGSGITLLNPGRHIPIAHFHGTADGTVAFSGNTFGMDADSLISFWTLNNACNPVPDSIGFSDAVNDSITIDKFSYTGSSVDDEVLFYRMNGADHTVLYEPDNDMTEIMEVWMFFRRHQNMTADVTSVDIEKNIYVYPNPATDFINIITPQASGKLNVELYTIQGALVYSGFINDQFHNISLNNGKFTNGMYLLRVSGENVNYSQPVIFGK